jgi:hypothetical protein
MTDRGLLSVVVAALALWAMCLDQGVKPWERQGTRADQGIIGPGGGSR